jgi:hypothetical protein
VLPPLAPAAWVAACVRRPGRSRDRRTITDDDIANYGGMLAWAQDHVEPLDEDEATRRWTVQMKACNGDPDVVVNVPDLSPDIIAELYAVLCASQRMAKFRSPS